MQSRAISRIATIVIIVIVIVAAITAGYFVLNSTATPTTSTSSSTSSLHSSSSTTLVSNACNSIVLNGESYCSLNVTNDIVLGEPGESYFVNGTTAINYMGVTFEPLCPTNIQGCPNQQTSGTLMEMSSGAIQISLTFPDNSTAVIGSILQNGGEEPLTILSNHTNPTAGVYIEYVAASSHFYDTFLLVSEATYTTTLTPSTSSSSSELHSSASISTINSTLGLKLILSLNSTIIPSEEAINITVLLENTLMTTNNLTAEADWPISASSGPCDGGDSTNKLYDPTGIAIFRGIYGLNNISSASFLPVWAAIECPANFAFSDNGTILGIWTNITNYSLLPGLDGGSRSGYYRSQSGNQIEVTLPTELTFGAQFYANNATGFQPYNTLTSAVPANYTVAAADEWGQIVLMHFQVVASHHLPVVGEFLDASGGCSASGYPVPCIASEFSSATIFNCAAPAQTVAGCQFEANSSSGQTPTTYTITVAYPRLNQTGEPIWANCLFNEKGEPTTFGYCFMINSTAFVFSEGGPAASSP